MNFCVTDGESVVVTRYISSKKDEAASLVSTSLRNYWGFMDANCFDNDDPSGFLLALNLMNMQRVVITGCPSAINGKTSLWYVFLIATEYVIESTLTLDRE